MRDAAQNLKGRRTRTLLPTAVKLLQPKSDPKTTARSLAARKRLQCKQYNRDTKNLINLKAGAAIRMKLPGQQKWSLGRCSRLLGRRSYEVQVDALFFRRNRHQLHSTLQPPPVPGNNNEEPHLTEHESSPPVLVEPIPDQCQTPPAPGIHENESLGPFIREKIRRVLCKTRLT